MMKKVLALCLFVSVAIFSLVAQGAGEAAAAGEKVYKVGISKLLPHPALDAAEQGMIDYLSQSDLKITFDRQNANGDIATSASIAQKFKGDRDDAVVGIATPTAQALANVFSSIPVVFSAVTDPASAGLVADNICGVSDSNPVESQIKLLHDITGCGRIGNIYASGEANGVVLMEMAQSACEKLGIEFVTVAISNTSEVKMACQSIIDRVDAVYIATDNAVISALPSIDSVCDKAGVPLFSSDPSAIEDLNVLIAWGFNYYSIGTATGKAVEKALRGTAPKDIGTVYLTDPADFELWFNLDSAKKLGITIDRKYLDMAAVIIQDGKKIEK